MQRASSTKEEVKVFEANAKEGARSVAFFWLSRRLVWPVVIILLGFIMAAFIKNGPIAGMLSLLVFAAPAGLILALWTGQFQKVWKYWAG